MAILINMQKNGMTKPVPVGFSWTTLFFGCLVPLFRGDWIWFGVMLLLMVFSFGVINFILCFFYNRIYVTSLINHGWVPADEYSYNVLRDRGIAF